MGEQWESKGKAGEFSVKMAKITHSPRFKPWATNKAGPQIKMGRYPATHLVNLSFSK